MKKILKFLGIKILLLIVVIGIYYLSNNESLPKGEKGDKAEQLAQNMMQALNQEAFENTEVLRWSFRSKNYYTWYKQEGRVEVLLGEDAVVLDLNDHSKTKAMSKELADKALKNFNNDSFWLVAPYKVFDPGTERSLVNYQGKDALLVTYTSGGDTPGDSYLWILDDNYMPVAYKMWVSIIPLGGVSATWSDLKKTGSGIFLPTQHDLSLLGMQLSMGEVSAENPNADALAQKVLTAVKHEAYKKTRYIEWSFGGRRNFKWDKEKHVVEVSWNDAKVVLHPNAMDKSKAYLKGVETVDEKLVKRAWDIFNNDSFWLVAPHKLFDAGTLRNIEMVDGKEALRVKYTSGGTTPGDAYIWILDSTYVPVKYKMFVPIMRMNGVEATWEDWITTQSGTLLPKMHTFSGNRKLSMGDVKAYN